MKALNTLILAVFLVAGLAHADPCNDTGIGIECGLTIATFAPFVISMTSSQQQGGSQAYQQELREEAADFLAQDGPAPAMLAEAMKQIRANDPQARTSSDRELAALIVDAPVY